MLLLSPLVLLLAAAAATKATANIGNAMDQEDVPPAAAAAPTAELPALAYEPAAAPSNPSDPVELGRVTLDALGPVVIQEVGGLPFAAARLASAGGG